MRGPALTKPCGVHPDTESDLSLPAQTSAPILPELLLKHTKDNTPVSKAVTPTDLTVDTVEVVDPTHPLYGKTLPLVGVTTKKDFGRAAIVWIRNGVERVVPLSATSLAATPAPPLPPCRLSVASVERLLAVVASLPDTGLEDEHAEDHHNAAVGESPGAARATPRREFTIERRGQGSPPAGGVDDTGAAKQRLGEAEMGRRNEGGGL